MAIFLPKIAFFCSNIVSSGYLHCGAEAGLACNKGLPRPSTKVPSMEKNFFVTDGPLQYIVFGQCTVFLGLEFHVLV